MCEGFINKNNYRAYYRFFFIVTLVIFIVIIIIIIFIIAFRHLLTIFINKKLFFNMREYIN